jgi:hypothetical protein
MHAFAEKIYTFPKDESHFQLNRFCRKKDSF